MPRREDRDRPDRLRRRPRQHRAGGDDAGADGHAARRTGSSTASRRTRRSTPRPARGRGPGGRAAQQMGADLRHRRRSGPTRVPAWSTRCWSYGSTASRARRRTARRAGPAHRRRLRHHDGADRARARVAREHPSERDRLSRERERLSTRRPRSSCASTPRRPATAAPSPPTARSPARSSRKATGCGCPGRWPTATRRCSPTRRDRPRPQGQPAPQLRAGSPPVHRLQRRPHGLQAMLIQVLDRMPDYVCDPDGAVHYDTVGVINGMR